MSSNFKKLYYQLPFFEKKLVIFFSIGFIINCLLLNDDTIFFNNEIIRKSQDLKNSIGRMIIIRNDVRKRNASDINWQIPQLNDHVIQEEMIYTGQQSLTKIRTPLNKIITIGENSLISIKNDNEDQKMALTLVSGKIFGDLDESINIYVKSDTGTNLKLASSNANVQLSKNKDSSPQIKVSNGIVNIQSNNSSIKVKTNQSLIFEGSTSKIFQRELILKSPQEQELIMFNKILNINFKWYSKSPGPYNIKITYMDILSKTVLLNTKTNSFSQKFNLDKAGEYKWKVTSANGESTEESSFYLGEAFIPKLIHPKNKFIFNSIKAKSHKIKFRWSYLGISNFYYLELTKDPDGKIIFYRTKASKETVSLNLPTGKYFWRLSTTNGDISSPFKSFTIK